MRRAWCAARGAAAADVGGWTRDGAGCGPRSVVQVRGRSRGAGRASPFSGSLRIGSPAARHLPFEIRDAKRKDPSSVDRRDSASRVGVAPCRIRICILFRYNSLRFVLRACSAQCRATHRHTYSACTVTAHRAAQARRINSMARSPARSRARSVSASLSSLVPQLGSHSHRWRGALSLCPPPRVSSVRTAAGDGA